MNDKERFDKFTKRAHKALSLALDEAQRLNHNYIGTEHLLLGLVRVEDGTAAKVLRSLGVELSKARRAVEFITSRGDRIVVGDIGLTPRAKKVIELAVDEARRLKQDHIGTEHLLLGMIREGAGIAAGVLESLGLNLEKARAQTVRVLGQSTSGSTIGTTPELDNERYDKFTEQTRKVLSLGQEEARRLNHNYIGTEHLLLGMVREGEGIAAKVLNHVGVGLEKARSAVESIVGRGDRIVVGDIWLTPRAKKVIELAVDEASRLNHHYIGTEHLLLGMVREGEGIAANILESLGVNLENLRARTLELLNQTSGGGGTDDPPETED